MKATIKVPIRAGDLRHRVTYQRPIYTSPPDEVASWSDFATVWAAVDPTDDSLSDEEYEAMKQTSVQYVIFRHRWIDGLNTTMRAVFGSTVYDVRAVADAQSRRRQHYVTCREVV